MIELPEAQVLAGQIAATLTGKTIVGAEANHSPHGFAGYSGDPAEYGRRLSGRTVTGAVAFGGIVDINLDELRLTLNDGAKARFYAPGEKLPPKHQLRVDFDDGSTLICTVQMYGGMMLPDPSEDGSFYRSKAQSDPSPLSSAFDAAYFESLRGTAKPTLSAKAFLATEKRIPGLGNGVLQDILFNARVNPRRKLGTLSDAESSALFESMKSTLSVMTELGGRDTVKDLFGQPGGYKTMLSSKTAQFTCPVCGGGIVREAYLGGNVYFCPTCQPRE